MRAQALQSQHLLQTSWHCAPTRGRGARGGEGKRGEERGGGGGGGGGEGGEGMGGEGEVRGWEGQVRDERKR